MNANELSLFLHNESDTVKLGQNIGAALMDSGGVIFLQGTLGAGKTTLTRGVLTRFGHSGAVKSPTYTLVEPYRLQGRDIYHFDLYRLADPEELEYMGIREYFDGQAVCIVEWPDQGRGFLPRADLTINLSPSGQGRTALISANTDAGQIALTQLINDNNRQN